MNFIRSVLEHHRQGGDADQLEEEYHRLAGNNQSQESNEQSEVDSPVHSKQPSNQQLGQVLQSNRTAPFQPNSNNLVQNGYGSQQNSTSRTCNRDETAATSVAGNQPMVLTAEQRARIEAKRAEALKRRQQRMQQQKAAPFNPYAK